MSSPEQVGFIVLGVVGIPLVITALCWLQGKYRSMPGSSLIDTAANYDLTTGLRRATPLSDAEARRALYAYRDGRV